MLIIAVAISYKSSLTALYERKSPSSIVASICLMTSLTVTVYPNSKVSSIFLQGVLIRHVKFSSFQEY